MQVSTDNSTIGCAIVGGQKPIDFKISNSPEFFNILSKSLYSNPKLAVIREILCNAWDAQIESGTDKVVDITVINDSISIRDYGKGISKEKMGEIYGIYGGSTKQNQDNQTGGFGLGCKAPFALVDNFEVTSYNNGVKTIYQLNKASVSTDGKPAIIPILSHPTDESGLEVKLQADLSTINTLTHYAKELIRLNNIPTKINGYLVENLIPFDHFLITREDFNILDGDICVQYGNVFYPIPNESEIKDEYYEVDSIRDKYHYWSKLILKAEPNSLAISPSRESLHLCDKTFNTLKKLLRDFINQFKDIDTDIHKYLNKKNEEVIEENQSIFFKLPNLTFKSPYINSYEDYVKHQTEKKFYNCSWSKFELIKQNSIEFGVKKGFIDKHLAKSIYSYKEYNYTPWFLRNILKPLFRAEKYGVDLKNIYICHTNKPDKSKSFAINICKNKQQFSNNDFSLLNKIVIFCDNKSFFNKLIEEDEADFKACIFYHSSKNQKKNEKAKEFFKRMKYSIKEVNAPVITKESSVGIKKEKPLKTFEVCPLNKGLRTEDFFKFYFLTNSFNLKDENEITKYKAIAYIPKKDLNKWYVDNLNIEAWTYIAHKFGKEILVVTKQSTFNSLISRGLIDYKDYVKEKLYQEIQNNSELKRAISCDKLKFIRLDYYRKSLIDFFELCSLNNLNIPSYPFILEWKKFEKYKKFLDICRNFGITNKISMAKDVAKFIKDFQRNQFKYFDVNTLENDKLSKRDIYLIKNILFKRTPL